MVNKDDARGKTGCIIVQFLRKCAQIYHHLCIFRHFSSKFTFLNKNATIFHKLLEIPMKFLEISNVFLRNWTMMHPVLPRASPLFTIQPSSQGCRLPVLLLWFDPLELDPVDPVALELHLADSEEVVEEMVAVRVPACFPQRSNKPF